MKSQSFSVDRRLTERESFNKVFSNHLYVKKTPFFSVFVGLGVEMHARLGVVVAKRNVRLAVARNRLKRFVRESFRLLQANLRGLDVVVVIKKDFALNTKQYAINLPEVFKMVGDKHLTCCKN